MVTLPVHNDSIIKLYTIVRIAVFVHCLQKLGKIQYLIITAGPVKERSWRNHRCNHGCSDIARSYSKSNCRIACGTIVTSGGICFTGCSRCLTDIREPFDRRVYKDTAVFCSSRIATTSRRAAASATAANQYSSYSNGRKGKNFCHFLSLFID